MEYCASIKSVKYLHKYIYKGHDCAEVRITVVPAADDDVAEGNGGAPQQPEERVRDEIAEYQQGRYVGASEASWRLFGFALHKEGSMVDRLPVHLPGQQAVLFDEDARLQAVAQRGEPTTKLTAYFALNVIDAEARLICYPDIPTFYTWQTRSSDTVRGPHWRRRERGQPFPAIGRMYYVSRNQVSQCCKGRSDGSLPVYISTQSPSLMSHFFSHNLPHNHSL